MGAPAGLSSAVKAATVVISAGACLLMVIPAAAWQRQVSELMGMEGPSTASYLRTLVLAAAVGGVCVAASRVLLDVIKTMARLLIRRWRLSDEIALFIGTAVTVALVVALVNGVLLRGFLAGANRVFQPQNTITASGVVQPDAPQRSGSPESFAQWDTLGYQGRSFVAGGPDVEELARINGRPAREPVRVYVGLQTADTDEARMAVLLSELERTRAFDREVLVIAPTTGTGWINPIAARSLEMMYNGDTAIVASQYSYLPSWISFIGDQQKSMQSGRLMIDAVHDRWVKLPPERRPRLVLFGESLGSMAGQGAFDWLPDISRMGFSSVLWVGPPTPARCGAASPCAATPERRKSNRVTTMGARCDSPRVTMRPRSPRTRHRHGTAPACCFSSTRPTRSSGGRKTCCSPVRTGCPSRRDATAPRRCGGIRSSRSGRSRPT